MGKMVVDGAHLEVLVVLHVVDVRGQRLSGGRRKAIAIDAILFATLGVGGQVVDHEVLVVAGGDRYMAQPGHAVHVICLRQHEAILQLVVVYPFFVALKG